jgi:hypothetical protein
LERNNRIFNEKRCNPFQVALKTKALLNESLEAQTKLQNVDTLDSEEEQWLKELVPNLHHRLATNSALRASWEVRMGEQDFIKWRPPLGMHSFTFNGASKGNPSLANGGGLLLDPLGMLVVTYSWGLGIETNNMAEALALWQGLRLSASKIIQKLVVFGDSRVIIQSMKTRRRPKNLNLSQFLSHPTWRK